MKIEKTVSEVWFEYVGYRLEYETGLIALKFSIRNPYFSQCSLASLRFQTIGGEWLPCKLADTQSENLDEIPLSAKTRIIEIFWDAAGDLRIMQAFKNVHLAISFNDRPYASGAETDILEFVLESIDFTLREDVTVVRPRDNDPYLVFQFVTPKTIRPARMHLRLEFDTTEDFNSPDLKVYDTSLSIEGWEADGGVFPVDGLDSTVRHKVQFSNAELTALPPEDYYFRVIPLVDQFYPHITFPENGQVYVGENIDVSGTVINLD